MTLLVPALLLLSVFGSLSVGEVVNDFFTTCGTFFAPDLPSSPQHRRPTVLNGPQYQQICQRLNNLYYYATLYDTYNRIPVYSAYQFQGKGGCDRKGSWYIEPQLDVYNQYLSSMAPERNVPYPFRGTNQALISYYEGTGYHKGHLAPVYQQNTQSCSDSTFTLTNAAPQDPSFNSGQWRVTQEHMTSYLQEYCLNNTWDAFIVTGVVPGNTWLEYGNVDTVNIPSHFWTAYCCVDNSGASMDSGAFIGANNNSFPTIPMNTYVLERQLTAYYHTDFQVFGGIC